MKKQNFISHLKGYTIQKKVINNLYFTKDKIHNSHFRAIYLYRKTATVVFSHRNTYYTLYYILPLVLMINIIDTINDNLIIQPILSVLSSKP